jgi:hypothetical protein
VILDKRQQSHSHNYIGRGFSLRDRAECWQAGNPSWNPRQGLDGLNTFGCIYLERCEHSWDNNNNNGYVDYIKVLILFHFR